MTTTAVQFRLILDCNAKIISTPSGGTTPVALSIPQPGLGPVTSSDVTAWFVTNDIPNCPLDTFTLHDDDGSYTAYSAAKFFIDGSNTITMIDMTP
jgi:hypothetical protein